MWVRVLILVLLIGGCVVSVVVHLWNAAMAFMDRPESGWGSVYVLMFAAGAIACGFLMRGGSSWRDSQRGVCRY